MSNFWVFHVDLMNVMFDGSIFHYLQKLRRDYLIWKRRIGRRREGRKEKRRMARLYRVTVCGFIITLFHYEYH